MKRLIVIFILVVNLFSIQSQTQIKFPYDQTFYFSNRSKSSVMSAKFSYDKNHDNAPICWISTPAFYKSYIWDYNSDGYLIFTNFTYQPEMKAIPSQFGPAMVQATGKVIKQRTNIIFKLSANYSKIIANGVLYDVRITKSEYDRLYNAIYSNIGGSGTSTPAYNGGSSSGNNSHSTSSICKYCKGSGACSSCKGNGVKFNSYSGHYDKCPSCNGSGKCFNCYGSGRQR